MTDSVFRNFDIALNVSPRHEHINSDFGKWPVEMEFQSHCLSMLWRTILLWKRYNQNCLYCILPWRIRHISGVGTACIYTPFYFQHSNMASRMEILLSSYRLPSVVEATLCCGFRHCCSHRSTLSMRCEKCDKLVLPLENRIFHESQFVDSAPTLSRLALVPYIV